MESPTDLIFRLLLSFIAYIRQILHEFLGHTIFTARPELASKYGDVLTLLVSFTALYLLLVFIGPLRKLVGDKTLKRKTKQSRFEGELP